MEADTIGLAERPMTILPSDPNEAFVSVWTKGFRISEDSDEFQRVIPAKDEPLLTLEAELHKFKTWPSVLEPLYGLFEHELASQRCMLVRSEEIGILSVERSEDKHGRPNLVILLVAVRIDWRDQGLGLLVARISNLAGRLASHFASTFRRNPAEIQSQLRASAFLLDRKFNLADEPPEASADWPAIIESVRKWRGVHGVATAKLATLGANVIIGTRNEAERAGPKVDGYIDSRTLQIVPLGSALTPWTRQEEAAPEKPSPQNPPIPPVDAQPPHEHLASIDKSLREINGSISRMADLLIGLTDGLLKLLAGGPRRSK